MTARLLRVLAALFAEPAYPYPYRAAQRAYYLAGNGR
jgi:hypothetical protein